MHADLSDLSEEFFECDDHPVQELVWLSLEVEEDAFGGLGVEDCDFECLFVQFSKNIKEIWMRGSLVRGKSQGRVELSFRDHGERLECLFYRLHVLFVEFILFANSEDF